MQHLIDEYGLLPHPEGGYYRETYRSPAKLAGTERSVSTAIYYLLPEGQRSSLHRIDADELWHFYRGEPLIIVELQPGAPAKLTRLSVDQPQHLVPAGTWFGSMPASGSPWCFVGCTVSPGFEFAHFELGKRDALLSEFPLAKDLIVRLTP